MSKWTHFRDSVENFFTGTLWTFFKPFAETLEHDGGTILVAAASNAVQAGFAAPGTGSDKMAAALAAFEAEIVAKGLPFVESQARALIEVALQGAKTAVAA